MIPLTNTNSNVQCAFGIIWPGDLGVAGNSVSIVLLRRRRTRLCVTTVPPVWFVPVFQHENEEKSECLS